MKRVGLIATAVVLAVSGLGVLSPQAYAAAQTCTWTGTAGDFKFSTVTNWTGCNDLAPLTGDIIHFDSDKVPAEPASYSIAPTVLVNDLTNVAFSGVEIVHTTGAQEMYISALRFADGAYFSSSNNQQLTVGAIPEGGTYVVRSTVTGDGALSLRSSGLYYDHLTLVGGLVLSGSAYVHADELTLGSTSSLTLQDKAQLVVVPSGAEGTYSFPIVTGGGTGTQAPTIWVGDYGTLVDGKWATAAATTTFSGNLTLNCDLSVSAGDSTKTVVKFTGAVSGSGKITRDKGSSGTLSTISGDLVNPITTTALDGDILMPESGYNPDASVTVVQNETATLNGKRTYLYIQPGGTLKGTGTVDRTLHVFDGGSVAPGNSPGCLTTGILNLGGEYQFELGGTDSCTGYDQIKVTSTVAASIDSGSVKSTTIANTAVLTTSRFNDYTPTQGQIFTIIDNQGPDAVDGTFKDLPEGATFEQNGVVFKISYVGGTGNDVTLTVQNTPTAPATGIAILRTSPALIAGATILGVMVMLGIARLSAKRR